MSFPVVRLKKNVFFLLTAILIAVIVVCIYVQNNNSINSVRFVAKAEKGFAQSVGLCCDDDIYYVFLPSYTDLNTMSLQYNGDRFYLDGKRYDSGSSFADIVLGKEYSFEIKNLIGASVSKRLVFLKSENVPAMSVSLEDCSINEINKDKEVAGSGFVSIVNPDKSMDHAGLFKALHGRGNTTWTEAKKPYALLFSQPVELLGMRPGTSWVLLSNSYDESGLRNKLAYDTAKEIGVEYAVDSAYVDLYIDDTYYGLYLLTARIEVGENRVDIRNLADSTQKLNYQPLSFYEPFETDEDGRIKKGFLIPNNPDDITGGYLMQTEHHIYQFLAEESAFQTDTLDFTVAHPQYASREQIDYIAAYVENAEEKLKKGDFSDIDPESFVNYYLIQEIFANNDESSAYMYKAAAADGGKLHACCIWDLDLSIGNSWCCPDMPPNVLYQSMYNWFPYLYQNKAFRSRLTERYRQLTDGGLQQHIYDKLDEYRGTIDASFTMNRLRWQRFYTDGSEAHRSQRRFQTLTEHIAYITDFMDKRFEFLDSVWIDGTEYRYVSFSTYENTVFCKWFTLQRGETIQEAPVPEPSTVNGQFFAGWFDEDGSEFVPGAVYSQNKHYTAKWEARGGDHNGSE